MIQRFHQELSIFADTVHSAFIYIKIYLQSKPRQICANFALMPCGTKRLPCPPNPLYLGCPETLALCNTSPIFSPNDQNVLSFPRVLISQDSLMTEETMS